jgi:hypothetical protein
MEPILDIVKTIFPNIVKDGFFYETPCVKIYIKDTFMHVSKINKCDEMTGNQTIIKIIELGHLLKENIGIRQINLTDTSTIWLDENSPINMSVYFILASGQSWYNRFGFISKTFADELEHNNTVRSLTIKEYCKQGLINLNTKKLDYQIDKTKQKQKFYKKIVLKSELVSTEFETNFFIEFKDLIPSSSIGSIFDHIKKNILLNYTSTQKNLLVKLINGRYDLFQYSEELVYIL